MGSEEVVYLRWRDEEVVVLGQKRWRSENLVRRMQKSCLRSRSEKVLAPRQKNSKSEKVLPPTHRRRRKGVVFPTHRRRKKGVAHPMHRRRKKGVVHPTHRHPTKVFPPRPRPLSTTNTARKTKIPSKGRCGKDQRPILRNYAGDTLQNRWRSGNSACETSSPGLIGNAKWVK